MPFTQSNFNIRCEWALPGVQTLTSISDAIIIVDVMSFSTAVCVAVSQGATVYPYRWKDDSAAEYANSVNAHLAGPRGKSQYSLSPISLANLTSGDRIVLPSPNGSTLSLATGDTPTFAGCLRNARVVANTASTCGKNIAVIPAGERWKHENSLRPAFEDQLGAGAVIAHLPGTLSPEAQAALALYEQHKDNLQPTLEQCTSGRQLTEMGFEDDIACIAQINCDEAAPILKDGAYIAD